MSHLLVQKMSWLVDTTEVFAVDPADVSSAGKGADDGNLQKILPEGGSLACSGVADCAVGGF